MNRTILYYPTIDIPSPSWLKHAVLYWDEVSSIVPKSWDDKILIKLSTDIQYLMAEGQFRPIKPEELIFKNDNYEVFEQFRREFEETVSSDAFQRLIQRQPIPNHRGRSSKVELKLTSRIHSNKTSDSIWHFLSEAGLAMRENHSDWLLFEKNTALLYMSLLAKYLADIDGNQTSVGTDSHHYEKLNFKRVEEDAGFPVVSFNLNKVLPTPRNDVPMEKILYFKRKRKDNLLHFKSHISEFQSKISKAKSQTELKEAAVNFEETLTVGVQDLHNVLADAKIESVFKSFKSLVNLRSSTLLTAAGTIANNKLALLNLPVSVQVAGILTIGAIELAGNYIELRNQTRAKERESPFSYVYQARQSGLLRNFAKS